MFAGLKEDFKQSLTWASVQMIALWGLIWMGYSQLPPDVMVQLAQTKFMIWKISLNVPTAMALLQGATTYLARMKKAPQ